MAKHLLVIIFLCFSCGDSGPSLINNGENNGENNGDNNGANNGVTTRSNNATNNLVDNKSDDPVVQFGFDFYLEFCKKLTECRETPSIINALSPFGISSTASCVQTLIGVDHPLRWSKSVAESRITFDGSKAAKCFSDIGALTCSEAGAVRPSPLSVPSCVDALKGEVAANEVCGSRVDCAAGLLCDDCPGKCTTLPAPECGEGVTCPSTQYCDFSDTPTCKSYEAEGGTCEFSRECEESLFCNDGKCTSFEFVGGGEKCDGAKLCPFGFFCNNVCLSYRRLGESCKTNPCESPLFCDTSDKCAPASESGACRVDAECVSSDCSGGNCVPPADRCSLD